MTKYYIIILILFLSVNTFGQTKKKLSKQLWNRVQSCYTEFEDSNEDGKLDDVNIIDDAKNGYLKISGTIGTCGCTCEKTVAAFKSSLGDYTFLEKETGDCSWLSKISSDKNLKSVFPQNFGIKTFIPSLKDTLIEEALFYLDIDIPQHGTETKVTLKIIPIGMHIKSGNLLVYNFSDDDKRANLKDHNNLQQVIFRLSNKGIDLIVNKCEKISKEDNEILEGYLKSYENNTIEELQNKLIKLLKIYDIYSKIEQQSILLKWDKNKARFIIKGKGNPVEPLSFYQFLRSDFLKYWIAIC